LAAKEPSIASGTTSQYWRGDKTWQPINWLTSETDTLASVTARGATTSVASSFTGGLSASAVSAGSLSVQIPTTSAVGAIIKGTAGQTADLLQVQDSTGTPMMRLGNAGTLTLTAAAIPSSINDGGYSRDLNQEFYAWNGGTPTKHTYTHRVYNVPGFDNYWADAYLLDSVLVWYSQKIGSNPWDTHFKSITADSGWVSGNGFGFIISGKFAIVPYGSSGANLYSAGTDAVNITAANAGTVGLKIRGVASQTADLQQWLDSSGAVKASISSTGIATATQYRLSALNTAPASATDTGTTGEIRVTSDYIYVCVATNTWVRAALTTW
jgi:hypothetical protein